MFIVVDQEGQARRTFEGYKDQARLILRSMRLSDQEIDDFIRTGLERIGEGYPPFEEGYPVSREKMISTLRYWRSKRKEHEE